MVSYGYLLPTRGVVSASDGPAGLTSRVHADVVDAARRAEALGYGSVWVGDSVLAKPRLEPLSTLAAVASVTDAVELGTAVYLPNLRHPVNVAHTAATVDQLSGGRLSLGVGVGVRPPEREEMEQLGVPYGRRGAMLDETLAVLTRLWTGDPVDYDGEFFSLDGASIGFPPSARPSIYVASAAFDPERGFPRTVRERLVEHGDGWLPIALDPDTYRAGLENVRGFVADAGRDPGGIDPAYYVDVVVADSEAAALDEARAFLKTYYGEQVSYEGEDGGEGGPLPDEAVRERGVFGTPDRVAERLGEFVDAGVERFVVRLAASDQRDQLRRFARVMDEV